MDVEFVDIERAALGLLRVTIDRPEGVRIEDCEQVSKHLSRVFEVENIDYRRLEVGSPGVDRPLKTEADFKRLQVSVLRSSCARRLTIKRFFLVCWWI